MRPYQVLNSSNRNPLIRTGGNSEGELSDPCNSPGRKVEVTTSDTENGRVKGNVKGRLGPIVGELTPPSSGDSSPGDDSSQSKAVEEVRLVKHVMTTVLSPSKRSRKRKPDSEIVHRLQPAIKVQRVAAAKKQAKPAMQIYRPPRAANRESSSNIKLLLRLEPMSWLVQLAYFLFCSRRRASTRSTFHQKNE